MNQQSFICPLCQALSTEIYHNKIYLKDDGVVFHCNECDLLFLAPRMSSEEEIRFYKNYAEHLKARGVVQGVDNPDQLYQMMMSAARARLPYIEQYIVPQGMVLEVGASAGSFLGTLLEKGFLPNQLIAIEPSDIHRSYLQNKLSLLTYCDINNVPIQDRYDVICLFHVLEHITEPQSFLRRVHTLLKSDGWLIIEVPSHTDAMLTLYQLKEFKDFYFQPMHPYVYSPKSLNCLLCRNGFTVKTVIPYQRYGLDNHLAWLTQKKPGGNPVLTTLLGEAANQVYKQSLERNGYSDTIFAIAQIA